ncbi:MAG: carboxypeptidase-like regulatory domain-containing protein [Ekhidna sp.]
MRIVFVTCILFLVIGSVIGQNVPKKKIIQFTGVVFGSDSTTVIPGTHIYIPTSGRGTTTNPYGFFSIPVMEGDSLVFSAVGYKRAFFKVPKHEGESSLKVIITLQEDITFLEEVEVRPYPTEAMFKEALITMELPYQKEYANIYKWLNSDIMQEAYLSLPASGNENLRYFTQQQQRAYTNRYSPPQNQLLNPFAWSQFIKSLKKKK